MQKNIIVSSKSLKNDIHTAVRINTVVIERFFDFNKETNKIKQDLQENR